MSQIHKTHYRVYYEDTDAGGIMYHGNFINFCERARSDMLRDVGYPASEVATKLQTGFVVRHLEAEYLAMCRLDDLLIVETTLKQIKNTSFTMRQVVSKSGDKSQNSVTFFMDVTLVCVDMKGRPTRIPDVLRQPFNKYLKEE